MAVPVTFERAAATGETDHAAAHDAATVLHAGIDRGCGHRASGRDRQPPLALSPTVKCPADLPLGPGADDRHRRTVGSGLTGDDRAERHGGAGTGGDGGIVLNGQAADAAIAHYETAGIAQHRAQAGNRCGTTAAGIAAYINALGRVDRAAATDHRGAILHQQIAAARLADIDLAVRHKAGSCASDIDVARGTQVLAQSDRGVRTVLGAGPHATALAHDELTVAALPDREVVAAGIHQGRRCRRSAIAGHVHRPAGTVAGAEDDPGRPLHVGAIRLQGAAGAHVHHARGRHQRPAGNHRAVRRDDGLAVRHEHAVADNDLRGRLGGAAVLHGKRAINALGADLDPLLAGHRPAAGQQRRRVAAGHQVSHRAVLTDTAVPNAADPDPGNAIGILPAGQRASVLDYQ